MINITHLPEMCSGQKTAVSPTSDTLKPRIVTAEGEWDPWSTATTTPTLLTSPFGNIIPSHGILIYEPFPGFLDLGHIIAHARAREGELMMKIESALYHPLPMKWEKKFRGRKIAVLDQPRDTDDWHEGIRILLDRGWMVLAWHTSEHARLKQQITSHKHFLSLQHSDPVTLLALIRHSSLILGGRGPTSRVAALLRKPIIIVNRDITRALTHSELTTDSHTISSDLRHCLLRAYPVGQTKAAPNAYGLTNYHTVQIPLAISSIGLRYTPNTLPLPAATAAECSAAPFYKEPNQDVELRGNIAHFQRRINKIERKLRKLANDPKTFCMDAKNPILKKIGEYLF